MAQIKKDFVTTINNPQKIHPPAYLSVDEVQVQDQTILHIYVPESSQVHRCNGRIYDRNEDGDWISPITPGWCLSCMPASRLPTRKTRSILTPGRMICGRI
ncbi:MAG: hypothetical protein U5L00_00250 [Desulfovermiculus sp.]|nr:hypothetical protein [Desulfovermiculus sp.]